MGKSVWGLISFVSFLALGTVGWAQTITGSQTRGQGTRGTLQSTAVTLPKGGYIIKVDNQGAGFWLESTTGITQQYTVDAAAMAAWVPAGDWQAFPMLKPGQDRASVTVTIGNTPPPKNDPCLIPDSFESIFDVAPQNEMAGPLLDAGKYYILIAPAGSANSWQTWGWRRYGPFDLRGGVRYQITHAGDLSQRGATAMTMSSGQTDVLFLNRSGIRVSFAVRSCNLPSTALSVSVSPAQQTVNSGEKVSITAKPAGGTPPYRYEWFDGSNRSNVTSATVTWTFKAPGPRDIKVIATDSTGKTVEAHAQIIVQAAPPPTVPAKPSTPSTTSSAGHWERGDAIITWDPPYTNEGGQAKKLGDKPYSGASWLSEGITCTLSFGSNHAAVSCQGPNYSHRWDYSWTEPPRILNAGQIVQFQIQVNAEGYVTLYEYEGDQSRNRNLNGGGTRSPEPFKIPAASDINSNVSKAEFGFFVGTGGTPCKWVYTYHWVSGSSGISPPPAK